MAYELFVSMAWEAIAQQYDKVYRRFWNDSSRRVSELSPSVLGGDIGEHRVYSDAEAP